MISKYEIWTRSIDDLGLPAYRLSQLKHAVFQNRIDDYLKMNTLPLHLRQSLSATLGSNVRRITPSVSTRKNQVEKLLSRLHDGHFIETVALQYRRGWSSFCVSSQCGCGLGCAFCATGSMGLTRNLSAEEITDQLLHYHLLGQSLDSVSFMGMGEPLANPNLMGALAILTDPTLFALGQRRITVSTTGIIPGIHKLSKDFPQVNLAFSLHTPFDRQRTELIPVNRQYPLLAVMDALDAHLRATGRKVFLAYTLFHTINDTERHLDKLGRLVNSRPNSHLYQVDLIPYNPVGSDLPFSPSSMRRMRAFQAGLERTDVHTTIRAQFGADIGAGCGQLCAQASNLPKKA